MSFKGFVATLFATAALLVLPGAALAAPGLGVTPSNGTFAPVEVAPYGTASYESFFLESTGTPGVTIEGFAITGPDSDDFGIANEPVCGYITGSCAVDVAFLPEAGDGGTRTAALEIENDSAQNPYVIPLSGTALKANFTASPVAAAFGFVVPAANPDLTMDVNIASDGTAVLDPEFELTDQSPATAFELTDTACVNSSPLVPGQDCNLTVEFDPTGLTLGAEYTASLIITSNGNSLTIPVSATPAEANLVPDVTSLDFGDVKVGETGSATLTLTSTGTAPITFDSPQPYVAGDDVFLVDQPASCSLMTTGQSCEVEIDFKPGWSGEISGFVEFQGNFGVLNVPLQGTGTEALMGYTAAVSWGEIYIGQESSQEVTLFSEGNLPLDVGAVTIEGADASQFSLTTPTDCTGLASGQECRFDVTYRPTAVGEHAAQLKVTGNAGEALIPLAGKARTRPPQVSLVLTGAKKVKRGRALTVTAKIVNDGDALSNITLKTSVPGKFAKAVKPIRIKSIGTHGTVTRKIKVQVKKTAKKGKKLKVTVTASGAEFGNAKASRTARIK